MVGGMIRCVVLPHAVVIVGFSESTYTVGEADAQVNVTVQRINSVARNFEILITKGELAVFGCSQT